MQTRLFRNYQALSEWTAQQVMELIIRKPNALICLASGDTPRLTCQLLAEQLITQRIDISRINFIGLDEWVGVNPDKEGSCSHFFHSLLFDKLPVGSQQVKLFDGTTSNLQQQCRLMDDHIAQLGGIDLMLVGIGMNGHIGFNEPGTAFDHYSHVVDLDNTTTTVGQKYFKEKTALGKGITLGLKHLLNSREVILMANGHRKADIVTKMLEGEVDPGLPATVLKLHSNSHIALDAEAAATIPEYISTIHHP